jgi:hypothetical protein
MIIKFIFIIFCLLIFNYAEAQEQVLKESLPDDNWLRILSPIENKEIIDKRPKIKVEFNISVEKESLLVLLDGTDITQMLSITENGFEYVPIFVLPAGNHVLNISLRDLNGKSLQKEITFNTRHSKAFEEAYLSNEGSIIYESAQKKPEEDKATPYSKLEGNVNSTTKIKEGAWNISFNTNIRYLDQSKPVFTPLQKGFQIANWLFSGSFSKGSVLILTNIGDIQLNETQYTISGLSRRGGSLNFVYSSEEESYELNVFSVKGYNVFGFHGGFGLGANANDHVFGISGCLKIIDKKVELKTIYVAGGEPGSSFGVSTTMGSKRGDVFGLLLLTNLLEDKFKTEIETDLSKYDPDTSDEYDSKNDKAHKFRVSGNLGKYSYDLMYEYIGRDYVPIGNQNLQKDKQGVSFVNNFNLGVHNINLAISRYNDNVRGDRLFPRIINYQGYIDYSLSKFQSFPIGINYQRSVQDSTREPKGYPELKTYTDTLSGRISYVKDKINLGFQASYSLQDDKTNKNYDTSSITYTFTPAYNESYISISPSFSLNQSKNHVTDVRIDTYTINLDLRTKFLHEKASFDVGGTYNIVKASDDSSNNKSLNINCRVAYIIKNLIKGYLSPEIALRGSYNKYIDDVNKGADKDKFSIFLVFATAVPFSF